MAQQCHIWHESGRSWTVDFKCLKSHAARHSGDRATREIAVSSPSIVREHWEIARREHLKAAVTA
jgi:hypothetical protein